MKLVSKYGSESKPTGCVVELTPEEFLRLTGSYIRDARAGENTDLGPLLHALQFLRTDPDRVATIAAQLGAIAAMLETVAPIILQHKKARKP